MANKVLMLHGYAQSGSIFYAKSSGFRKSLAKLGYELYYPCAPNRIAGADIRDMSELAATFNTQAGTDDIFGWWLKDPNDQYKVPQKTIDFLHDYIIENGPFDGIMGFSQGAGYAGYLCSDVRKLLNLTEEQQPDFKFFVSFSGFRMAPEWFQEQYNKSPITVPSLHVLGELDTVVESSRVMRLYESCSPESRALLKHPGGHFVPNGKGFVTKVTNWLQMLGSSDSQPETSDTTATVQNSTQPDLDDDLLAMIDGLGKA
ncbi:LANO_0H17238g1_1 [Lachancea nothofagi CBS 11611]|uniref:LANO_0H17238g1_1 n=1 Tax=Lachancea nothofagi CBS 11611 TaxID=1266666 RepID=A0A1G4KMV9_9SACH|nr:LANO_0H17238g1_1 [Lachancea nothofagi CBS 11611]